MKRRKFLNSISLLTGAVIAGMPASFAASLEGQNRGRKKPVLTVAHITDVHIREGDNAPQRFKQCLNKIIAEYKPDFFLNGGDSIHDASYDDVKRKRVTQLWGIWDDCITTVKDYEV